MALYEDEPPHSGDDKIKKLQTLFSKNQTLTKYNLQKLLKTASDYKAYLTDRAPESLRLSKTLSFFITFSKKFAPHLLLAMLTILTVASNYVVRAANSASSELAAADPRSEISIATSIDRYTPLIVADSNSLEKSYLASMEYNIAKTTVATVITERTDPALDNSNKTITYTVKPGDTLTTLGWTFSVKLATLKYLNNIDDADSLKPGQSLKIPQQGYEVSATLIAQKEKDKQKKLAASSRNTVIRAQAAERGKTTGSKVVSHPAGSKSNGYPYGYCTYYVATRRAVPSNFGNAKAWLGSAQRAGYSTGSAPAVGSIVVTAESWWGHVAYVESVDGGNITIAEMNAKGWGVTSRRTLPAYGGVVRGYIY